MLLKAKQSGSAAILRRRFLERMTMLGGSEIKIGSAQISHTEVSVPCRTWRTFHEGGEDDPKIITIPELPLTKEPSQPPHLL